MREFRGQRGDLVVVRDNRVDHDGFGGAERGGQSAQPIVRDVEQVKGDESGESFGTGKFSYLVALGVQRVQLFEVPDRRRQSGQLIAAYIQKF